MNDERRRHLLRIKSIEQHGVCGVCGESLEEWYAAGKPVELAHKVPRGEIRRKVGKHAEWDARALVLVCTRRGKACNDGALLPIGLARDELIEKLRRNT